MPAPSPTIPDPTGPIPDPSLEPPDLPPNWPRSVQEAIIHVISLAQFSLSNARGLAVSSGVSKDVKVDKLNQEIAHLREERRLKDARTERVPARERPYYESTERLAILELRAARAWSKAETAPVFQVSEATIASWAERLDEEGPEALLKTREPVNKYPDFVRHIVQRLTTLCPHLGKVKIAQILARAGLHLAASTVGRIRREKPAPMPDPETEQPAAATSTQPEQAESKSKPAPKRITSKYPNHI